MFFSREARKKFNAPLETGTRFRVPVNFPIREDFPKGALFGEGRHAAFFSYLKKEFLRFGLNKLGFLLVMKQEDYERWGEVEDFIREEISLQAGEIGKKLGSQVITNKYSVEVVSDATILSLFSLHGIPIEETYDFEPGQFILIVAPFLYREGNEIVGEVKAEVDGERMEREVFLGQTSFVVGEEWFYNLWIPQMVKRKIRAPLRFSLKDGGFRLSNIQERGNRFKAIIRGITIGVERLNLEGGVSYSIVYEKGKEKLNLGIEFFSHRPLAEIPEEEVLTQEEGSIYEDFSSRTEDLSLKYLLLPKPMGPVKEYQAFVGPQGEVFDEKLLTCLGIKVTPSHVEIRELKIPHYQKFEREFRVGAISYRVGTGKFTEKLWALGNHYFLFEIELPQPKAFYIEGIPTLVGRDPSCHINLPSTGSRDFRTIHSSRFHGVLVKEEDSFYVVNISAHFKIYVFRQDEVLVVPPFGRDIYKKVKRLALRENSLAHVLNALSAGGKPPSYIPLQSGDMVLIGNSLFRVSEE